VADSTRRTRWLRWAAVAVALLGALAVLLPWVCTEIAPAEGPAEVGYTTGVPTDGVESGVVGWNAVLASAAFAAFALLTLALPEGRGRTAAAAGLVAGLAAMLLAARVFAAPNPLGPLAGKLTAPGKGPVQIRFTPAVGPYAAFALGLALSAVSAALGRSAGGDAAPRAR